MANGEPEPGDGSTGRRRIRGADDVCRALDAGAPVRMVFVDARAPRASVDAVIERARARGVELRELSARSLRRLGGPGETVDVLALAGPDPAAEAGVVLARPGPAWLLVGVEYPGNAGLAVRTAEVSGAVGIWIDAAFDAAARKACLRASMRSERLMPVRFAPWSEVIDVARGRGRRVVVVEDVGPSAPWDVDLTAPSLFVVGGEADGVPRALMGEADACIRIPTPGFVSSYNVQVAMAIVVGETLRQRGA
jgi:tRNA G18 (ribose-2'-O)-methylase SpoU